MLNPGLFDNNHMIGELGEGYFIQSGEREIRLRSESKNEEEMPIPRIMSATVREVQEFVKEPTVATREFLSAVKTITLYRLQSLRQQSQ